MHRRIKGLLSLALVFVMVTATVNPVLADEQPQEPLAEEAVELPQESEQPEIAVGAADEEKQPQTQQEVTEEQSKTQEAQTQTQQQTTVETQITQLETEPVTETQADAQQPTAEEETGTEELPPVETDSVVETEQVVSTGSETNSSDPIDFLTAEQKQFRVYSGTQPIKLLSETTDDMLAQLKFMDGGIVPDSANMPAQSGTIIKKILESRVGDARFYMLAGWNLWDVRYDGIPNSVYANAGPTALGDLATLQNFKNSMFFNNNGTGTEPDITFYQPVLEPVWSCIDYPIPVYDAQGQNTGLTVTVNAENYNDPSKVAFPNIGADSWKLVYEGSEYVLNSASEIWTNTTNGIGTIGRNFNERNAKLQACTLMQEGRADFTQPDWYEGQQPAAPIVSSETNGTDHITYYYKEMGADDSTYTTVIPKTAGKYTAKAVFAAVGIYREVIKIVDFNILSATAEIKYEISGPQGTEGWYTGAVTICAKDGYQVRISETDEWTNAVTVAQSGNVMLYVKKTDGTEYPAEALQFLIDETDPVIVGVQNGVTYYGETAVAVTDAFLLKVTVNDELQTVSDNQANFVLKPSEQPYIIKAEDMAGNWLECTVWVKEKEAEIPPVLQEGTAEFIQPGWYVGEEMPAPLVSSETNGIDHITYYYKEAGADDSAYTATVPNKAGKYTAKAVFAATQLYQEVVKTADFEILEKVMPDETMPVISGVADGQTYYGDQTVTVTDENLRSVTINGEAAVISDNRAEVTLKPSDNVYKIIAEDMAGNRTEYTVEVLETWVRDGITSDGKKNLRAARIYKLGGGKWTVAGDKTVYQGGRTFYVKTGGAYDFKKK